MFEMIPFYICHGRVLASNNIKDRYPGESHKNSNMEVGPFEKQFPCLNIFHEFIKWNVRSTS